MMDKAENVSYTVGGVSTHVSAEVNHRIREQLHKSRNSDELKGTSLSITRVYSTLDIQ